MERIGKISELYRYPIKSMLGEFCENVFVNYRGFEGDRTVAVKNEFGRILSGKKTKSFEKSEGLLYLQAGYFKDDLMIELPGDAAWSIADPKVDEILSNFLGEAVYVSQEMGESFFDVSGLHILTTGSLRWLETVGSLSALDVRRFRPNIVIDVNEHDRVENDWIGQHILIGDSVELRITSSTERCSMVALAQSDLRKDPAILKSIASFSNLNLGVYAEVVTSGFIRQGEAVSLI